MNISFRVEMALQCFWPELLQQWNIYNKIQVHIDRYSWSYGRYLLEVFSRGNRGLYGLALLLIPCRNTRIWCCSSVTQINPRSVRDEQLSFRTCQNILSDISSDKESEHNELRALWGDHACSLCDMQTSQHNSSCTCDPNSLTGWV